MKVHLTHHEWVIAARARYGRDSEQWRFRCPCCGHVARIGDWRAAGAVECAGFACIGHWRTVKRHFAGNGPGPCTYMGGGVIRLNPIHVNFEGEICEVFDFADRPLVGELQRKDAA